MVKKLLTLIMVIGLAFSAAAQWPPEGNAIVSADEVTMWCGSGTNTAVIAVTWNDATAGDIGFAWGVKWNGTINIGNAMDSIAAYDPRFTVLWSSSHSFINKFGYTDETLGLDLMDAEEMRMYNWKDEDGELYSTENVIDDILTSGDFVDWLYMDPDNDYEVVAAEEMFMATPIVNPNRVSHWIGSGANSATFTLHFNQNNPNLAFVWGFHWDDPNDDYTVEQMMEEIADADDRISFDGVGSGFLNSYSYSDDNYDLTAPTNDNFAGFIMNNTVANAGMASMPLADGDQVAWCDANYDFFSGTIDLGAPSFIYVLGQEATDTAEVSVDATIAAGDILYWVGEGSNEVILAVNWADTALAWGYRFSTDSVSVTTVMDDIAAADPRFSYTPNTWGLGNILFVEGADTVSNPVDGNWMSTLNGNSNASAGMATMLANNDFFKWGDYLIGTTIDSETWAMVFTDTIHPASVPEIGDTTSTDTTAVAVDATIAASDILFWVGSGNNSAILAVNWADTALAWGYRFTPSSTTVQQMMDDIAVVDPRFSYTPNTWGLGNILFVEGADTVSNPVDGNWMSTLNGNSNASAGMGTTIQNGDFFKWGDYLIGTTIDPETWAMVFTDSIYAVSVPDSVGQLPGDTTIVTPEHGPFCGGVGSEGCDAIKADSSAIIAWATGIELNRGPQNISVEGSPLASYGAADSAIGPATNNTMRAVSLGDGGTATVTFAHPIRNGEGPDFAVFENGFANQLVGNYSLELAFVEVSSDGERFVRFPATSLTQTESQTANAGAIDPTNINNLAGKYEVGYGTPFDLAELADSTGIDIDSIVYVRIVDVVGSINPQYATYDAQGNIINDPWPTPFNSSGFDLTGVAVMYEREDVEPTVEDASIAASNIIYWVGEGSNEVVFAINWADSALAWGYRFTTDSVVVSTIISDIVDADPRLSIEGDATFVSDFIFVDSVNNRTLRLTPHDEDDWGIYFNMQVNHVSSMLGAGMHMVGNGDFIKFADTYVAVKADSIWVEDWGGYWDYTYVWPYEITPVSVPGSNNAIDATGNITMSLYPNPAISVVNVTVSEPTEAVLFDMAGRRVMTVSLAEGRNTLDLSTIESGVYMLRTSGHVEKIVKR